jgi:hypothetical protein
MRVSATNNKINTALHYPYRVRPSVVATIGIDILTFCPVPMKSNNQNDTIANKGLDYLLGCFI